MQDGDDTAAVSAVTSPYAIVTRNTVAVELDERIVGCNQADYLTARSEERREIVIT